MNARAWFGIGFVAVVVFGCHRHKPRPANNPDYGYAQPGYQPSPTPGVAEPAPVAAQPASGTCEASCAHYLGCKGNYAPGANTACITKCNQMGLSRPQLVDYEATDCTTAVWQAEHTGGTGGTTGTPKSSECNGCVWDGSACIWLSQSNWGAGPYSGAASSCKTSCCPGH